MKVVEIYRKYQECNKVVIDSRKVENGDLFIAIKGENHDANDFLPQVLEKGAKHIISDNYDMSLKYEEVILVEDAILALQELAKYHRSQLTIPIVGITGSNGKTTTKELCREVLSTQFMCYATKGNYNNHIGVPLSILDINKDYEIAIIEMGANHRGEIKFLSDITLPTHGIITNIGSAHLEGFGSLQGVIDTKTELYASLEESQGNIFYNANSELLKSLLPGNTDNIPYGNNLKVIALFPELEVSIDNNIFKSGLVGNYNAINIACADKLGDYFKVNLENRKQAIGNYSSKINRSQIVKIGNTVIISDAYNANPTSMKAAIGNFIALPFKRKVLILGDMLELGPYSLDAHQEIVDIIKASEYQNVILVGEEFKLTNHSYLQFSDIAELKDALPLNKLEADAILLKGSRGIKLEQYLNEKL